MILGYELPDRYSITDTGLGGGMGDIISCRDNHLDRKVIIKVLKDDEEHRRLLDEQRALLKLRSKHVVQLYDIIDIRKNGTNKRGLVLEYIDGADLSFDASANLNDKLKILWQVACGLSDIHAADVIHRDIKPNNIRINKDDIVKILDFGLARSAGHDAQTINIIGTPGYISPEQWIGKRISFDHKIDVYAFGVLVFDIFGIEKPIELLAFPPKQLSDINLLNSYLPNELSGMFISCLNQDKDKRPNISVIRDALAKYLLKDKHRAIVVLNNKIYEISSKNRDVTITWGGQYSMKIEYDGFEFKVSNIIGDASINNKNILLNDIFPSCSVITLNHGVNRTFVTFDISRPEVIS